MEETGMLRRFYEAKSVLPFGEDSKHEFKGHRCLSVEELPKWCFIPGTLRRSRKAVSRTLNGFLNTGQGGTVYLGVLDDGTVKGIPMSMFQMEHLKVSLTDLLRRYNPPVKKSRYKVCFVPVITTPQEVPPVSVHVDQVEVIKGLERNQDGMRFKAHLLRTSKWCWCDKRADEQFEEGVKHPTYVVEITIHPFLYRASADPVPLQLYPVYEDEEGRCYIRRTASNSALTHQEVAEMTRIEAKNHFEKVIHSLRNKLLEAYEEHISANNWITSISHRECHSA